MSSNNKIRSIQDKMRLKYSQIMIYQYTFKFSLKDQGTMHFYGLLGLTKYILQATHTCLETKTINIVSFAKLVTNLWNFESKTKHKRNNFFVDSFPTIILLIFYR